MDLRSSSSGCFRSTPSPGPSRVVSTDRTPSNANGLGHRSTTLSNPVASRHEPLDRGFESDETWNEAQQLKEVKDSLVPLIHQWKSDYSIMCLASTNDCIFAGTESGEILVYDLKTFQVKCKLEGHVGSVYNMVITPSSTSSSSTEADQQLLLSVSSDSLVKVWRVDTLQEQHSIYSLYDIGDLFSIAWSEKSQILFLGAQNASIQWVDLFGTKSTKDTSEMPSIRYNKFFDSKQRGSSSDLVNMSNLSISNNKSNGQAATTTSYSSDSTSSTNSTNSSNGTDNYYASGVAGDSSGLSTPAGFHTTTNSIQIPRENIIRYAHNGYVYCMLNVNHPDRGDLLVSGAGDGTLNVWSIVPVSDTTKSNPHSKKISLKLLKSAEFDAEVLSLSLNQDANLVFVGLEDESVAVFDLDTLQTLQKDFQHGTGSILSLSVVDDCVFRGSASDGSIMKWDIRNYQRVKWKAHDHHITSSLVLRPANSSQIQLISGGDDCKVCLWDVTSILEFSKQQKNQSILDNKEPLIDDNNMIRTLKQFVSYQTISSQQDFFMTHCRKGAVFTKNLLAQLGADAELLPVEPNRNPIVYGKFSAETSSANKARILFYGHYDVIRASNDDQWDTPPFEMTAQNGYLYGRGVSDNKGPVIAAIFAAAEIFHKKKLQNDIVFLIEGEEECGSTGLISTIQKHRDLIGDIDWILLSNSYWINDTTPCLNYGLRGTVCMDVHISNGKADLHSGVNGGVVREPTIDLISILSGLVSSDDKIQIPGFYDSVRDVDTSEMELYKAISANPEIEESTETLMKKWRYPSLTIHSIKSSGPNNSTVIPAHVSATLSVRIVPDQEIDKIKASLQDFLRARFDALKSPNKLTMSLVHDASPWVGNPNNEAFQILRKAIKKEWDQEPLFIREGGSIPMVRLLEKTFNAPAAQMPCGQSSDGAHLNNERLRVTNFIKSRAILRDTFMSLGRSQLSS